MSIDTYKTNPVQFRVRIRDSTGRSYSRVLKAGITKTQAKKFEQDWRIELEKQLTGTNEPTLVALLERWLTKVAVGLVGLHIYESHARQILPYLGNHTINSVALVANNMQEDMVARGYAPSTINKRIGMLRRIAWLAYHKWEITDDDQSHKILQVKNRKGREIYITRDELWDVYDVIHSKNKEVAELVIFAAYTGIRFAEMGRLGTDSIEKRGNKLWLNIRETKEGTPRAFPLPENALKAYLSMQAKFPITLTYNHLLYAFKKGISESNAAKNRPELLSMRWHDLRHSFASFLAQGGASLIMLQHMMGHRTLQSTQRYTHLCDRNFEEASAILDGNSRPALKIVK